MADSGHALQNNPPPACRVLNVTNIKLRKIALLMLSLGFAGNAMAEWTAVSKEDGITVYADLGATSKAGPTVIMWFLFDFETVQDSMPGARFLSVTNQQEYNCKKHTFRRLAVSYYPRNMAGGTILHSDDVPSLFEFVPPASRGLPLWKIACGK